MTLGQLDSKRDWGHAKDYVKGMWMMLQQEKSVVNVFVTHACFTFVKIWRDNISTACFNYTRKNRSNTS